MVRTVDRRMPRAPLALFSCVALAGLVTAPAQGQRTGGAAARRVVIEDAGAPLLDAARVALQPWGVEVLPRSPLRPGDAEVRLRDDGDGTRLEVRLPDERVELTRRLPVRRPLDPPGAAAVALSLKTLLRNTPLAPAEERLPTPPPAPPAWRLGLGLGARLLAFEPSSAEARLDLRATWFPELPGGGRPIGVGLEVSGGLPVPVDRVDLDAWHHTVDLVAQAEGRLPVADRWLLAASIGLGGRLGVLDGEVAQAGGGAVTVVRVDPLARVAAELVARPLPRLELGLRVGTAIPLRRQAYRVRGREALREAPASLDLGLTIGFLP